MEWVNEIYTHLTVQYLELTRYTHWLNETYTTLAWAFKGAARCLTRIFPGQYHGKAVCQ